MNTPTHIINLLAEFGQAIADTGFQASPDNTMSMRAETFLKNRFSGSSGDNVTVIVAAITGTDEIDLQESTEWERIQYMIQDGFSSGFDKNEHGSFVFDVKEL